MGEAEKAQVALANGRLDGHFQPSQRDTT